MRLFSALRSRLHNPKCTGPIKRHMNNAKETIKDLDGAKQWFCGGYRSAAIAAQLLLDGKVIAIPTDTIYGLAGLAQNNKSIKRLYEIKKRDGSKPLAICLWSAEDISNWAHTDYLPKGLIDSLLPGPTTLILRRKSSLNPILNPEVTNVGVRVPDHDFTRSVVRMVNQPIALTSANVSNQQSTLHPTEFEDLWSELDGVFWQEMSPPRDLKKSWRKGSTIVDLTVEGEFHLLRKGTSYWKTVGTLKLFGLKRRLLENEVKSSDEEVEEKEEEDELVENGKQAKEACGKF